MSPLRSAEMCVFGMVAEVCFLEVVLNSQQEQEEDFCLQITSEPAMPSMSTQPGNKIC